MLLRLLPDQWHLKHSAGARRLLLLLLLRLLLRLLPPVPLFPSGDVATIALARRLLCSFAQ
jgi:hypothetical protein